MALLFIIFGNYSLSQNNLIGPPLTHVNQDSIVISTTFINNFLIHIVVSGDYLSKIAKKYDVQLSELYAYNEGLTYLIHPGEYILIPIYDEPNNYVEERMCLKSSYESQIGVREATGNNDGFDVEKYLASSELGKGYSWCAAFINWNYQQCNLPAPKKSAWVPSWFPKSKLIYVRGEFSLMNPQSGDLIGIWFNSKKRLAHIGIYDHEDDTYYYTVEGNTNEAGSREGDGVYRKRRIKRQVHSISSWIND